MCSLINFYAIVENNRIFVSQPLPFPVWGFFHTKGMKTQTFIRNSVSERFMFAVARRSTCFTFQCDLVLRLHIYLKEGKDRRIQMFLRTF